MRTIPILIAAFCLASCMDQDASEPVPAHPRPLFDVVQVTLGHPTDNTTNNGATPWTNTFAQLDADKWYEVKVVGGITLSARSEYLRYATNHTPGPLNGQTLPPCGGGPYSELKVSFRGRTENNSVTDAISVACDNQEAQTGHGFLYFTSPVSLEFMRTGVIEGNEGGGAYILEGNQRVEIREVLPAQVTEDKRFITAGDSVSFQLSTGNGTLITSEWYFIAGDTGAVPLTPSYSSRACSDGGTTCKIPITASGRMHVRALTNSMTWRYAIATSDVVWVGTGHGKASVTCPTTERGQNVTCVVASDETGASMSVQEWRFEGDDAPLTVVDSSGSTSWSGVAAASGKVQATVLINNVSYVATAHLTVTPRNFHWSSNDWSFGSGQAPDCTDNRPFELADGDTLLIGWNVRANTCLGDVVLPQPMADSGWTSASVASGPNKNVWYVTSASYYISRQSNWRPEIGASSTTTWTVPLADQAACGTTSNWYNYNICKSAPISGFASSIVPGHEGRGANSYSDGHMSNIERAASYSYNDPRVAVESAVASDSSTLRTRVFQRGVVANVGLVAAAAHEPNLNLPVTFNTVRFYYRDVHAWVVHPTFGPY